MKIFDKIVEGREVALVGNAASLLREDRMEDIDFCDVVIRMNLGLPTYLTEDYIGRRTTIWATAKYFPSTHPPFSLRSILFMKLTKLGDLHWQEFLRSQPSCALERWPQEAEDECREFVGADPGTGIRLLWWLKTRAQPASIKVFGMDCWDTVSHWSGKKNTPNHRPDLERAAMQRLLG